MVFSLFRSASGRVAFHSHNILAPCVAAGGENKLAEEQLGSSSRRIVSCPVDNCDFTSVSPSFK